MKYFLRILAFLFISFSSLFASTKCGVLLDASEFNQKACSVGGMIYNVSWDAGDEHFNFSDDYLYEFIGKQYLKVEWTYTFNSRFLSNDFGSNPDMSCIVCSINGYNRHPKKKCPAGEYPKLEKSSSGNYVVQTCTSECFELHKRRDRFDCTCNKFGLGNYVSSSIDSVIEISNGGSGGTFYNGKVQCENGSFTDKDISDYISSLADDSSAISQTELKNAASTFMGANDYPTNSFSGSSDGSSDGSSGGEQGSTEPTTPEQQQQEQDRNECKAIVAAITADFRAYTQKYVNNGIDCSDSNAVQLARDAKSTIEMKVQTYNQSKCATAYHRINVTVPVHSCKTDPTKPDPIEPPAPQNPSDTIKYDENTNTVTITDSTGNTQAVTPSDLTKDEKGNLQTIKYTDPETGKTIEYKVKEDGTWERVEYPGQGTGTGTNPSDKEPGTGQGEGKPGGSSEGEGAGTSEDGKDDSNKDGEGNFEGGEFGALGNANDFDEGGLLSGLNDELDSLSEENIGLLDGIIENISSYIDDLKQSIDNLKDKADALKSNPFSSSKITSCPTDFSLLDQSIRIDLCEHTSKFSNLFYAIFYLALNVFIAFGMFRLFVLILVSI